MNIRRIILLIASPVSLISGCAGTPAFSPTDAPIAIRAPSDQVVLVELLGKGVQIYACLPKSGSDYDWSFKGPEAELDDLSGQLQGKHYSGPTWESNDGSLIVGEVKAKDPGPNPTAIPWLLLSVTSVQGTGLFSAVKSIQRVNTSGGLPPSEACSQDNVNLLMRVPYTATYVFYRTASLAP